MKTRPLIAAVFVTLTLSYPFVVFFGLQMASPRHLALVIGVLFLLRLIRLRAAAVRPLILPAILCLGVCAWSTALDDEAGLLLLPVFISGGFLLAFGWTLVRPPSIVEAFARLVAPDLSDAEVRYCRRVTWVWAVFFVVNGTVAWLTTRQASREAWVIYNGLISYLIIGGLFVAELFYRHWRFRRYVGLPTDPFFRKIFPPHDASERHSD